MGHESLSIVLTMIIVGDETGKPNYVLIHGVKELNTTNALNRTDSFFFVSVFFFLAFTELLEQFLEFHFD